MSDIPTSGAISLNQMHTEAGGTSGTEVSINDADIRALINKAANTQMSFSEWYGASANWTATLTVAAITTSGPKGATFTRYGFISGSGGSLSDTTVDTLSNHTISTLASNPDSTLGLRVTLPASGWTSIRLYDSNRDNTIARTSMTYASASGLWYINNSTVYITSTNGATMTVEVII